MENKSSHECLISIVIPIYNTEKYLERCIESVIKQTYRNLEIILVDDGSSDNCPEICNRWRHIDKRIKVIHKINAGLGMARNTGIENATGDFICFLDSDDYIEIDTIEKVLRNQRENKSEIVCFGWKSVDKNGKIKGTYIPNTPCTVFVDKEVQQIFLPNLLASDTKTGQN